MSLMRKPIEIQIVPFTENMELLEAPTLKVKPNQSMDIANKVFTNLHIDNIKIDSKYWFIESHLYLVDNKKAFCVASR